MGKRGLFSSRWGFILACIGSAVGMGNIWMFPTRVSLYGGGSFLIPYLIFVVLIAFTGVIGEMSFGRATKSGPVGAFGAACATRRKRGLGETLGLISVIGSMCLAIGYTVVMGWILKYTVGSFTGATLAPTDVDGFASAFGGMASAYGNNVWQLAALVMTVLILMLGVNGGIENTNKIIMPLFFFMFLGLGIYAAFQPGAIDGYKYIFRIDPVAIRDPKTWIFALGQAFFSLSVAGNGTLIYGSYFSDRENVPQAAARVAFFDTLAAFLAALVIIPAMATTGAQLNQGGPGLLFIFLPNLFKTMPAGNIVTVVFFVAVLFGGFSSLINLYEAPIATVQERLGFKRVTACAAVGIVGAICSILIQGIVSDWMDIVSIYVCPLGAGLCGIMYFWIFGRNYVENEVSRGLRGDFTKLFFPVCKFVYVPICFIVLVLGAIYGGI